MKRDDEEEDLLEQIEGHEKKLEALAREKQQLQLDHEHLKRKLAIQDQGGGRFSQTYMGSSIVWGIGVIHHTDG